jgi:aspartate aminotransferase-like enzyme
MTDHCKYFIPGPAWVRPEILSEMTRPMIGHRSQEFESLMSGLFPDLRELFRTKHHAFVAATSGTGLLEAAMSNCVERSVLVTTCGAFSERWLAIANQLGLEVDHLEFEWGQPVDPARFATHLEGRRHRYDAVTFTHNETSTGVLNDLPALAGIVRRESPDSLIMVDAVSSLASAPILFDEWDLDVCVSGSQKGLAVPPGLGVFAVSERAMEAAAKERFKSYYFDFQAFRKNADNNNVPFTPALPLVRALAKQLDYILRDEGLEARWNRHLEMRDRTIERTARFADLLPPLTVASPSVTTLVPKRGTGRQIVTRMKESGFTIGGGYGKLKEETFRIGHMGDCSLDDVEEMLDVLENVAAES